MCTPTHLYIPTASLDLPALEDSDIMAGEFLRSPLPLNASSSSSSSALGFSSHVAGVMGGRTQLEFQELLPPDCTRKTASEAFAHVLSECYFSSSYSCSLFVCCYGSLLFISSKIVFSELMACILLFCCCCFYRSVCCC